MDNNRAGLKSFLISIYLFLKKRVFGGRGLSRLPFLKNLNFAIEEFLRGKTPEHTVWRGIRIYLDPFGSLVSTFGGTRPFETDLIESSVKEGNIFVDIGASIGWFTLLASRKVGTAGKVYAFEPDPRNLELLEKNIKTNNANNIIVVPKAASDRAGSHSFFIRGKGQWGRSSFFDPDSDPERLALPYIKGKDTTGFSEKTEIEMIKLDDYFKGKKVDVIKIEINGAEALAQAGMLDLIRANRDIKIFSKFSPILVAATGSSPRGYLDVFAGLGLQIFDIDEDAKKLVPMKPAELAEKYNVEKGNGGDILITRKI
ncbi:MAG: FkbM family methyltransferase [Patescibacteria group bacterium]